MHSQPSTVLGILASEDQALVDERVDAPGEGRVGDYERVGKLTHRMTRAASEGVKDQPLVDRETFGGQRGDHSACKLALRDGDSS